jgi:rubredoxin
MPHRICPKCRIEGTLLEMSSSEADLEYYHCAKCAHIWTHQKGDPEAAPPDVSLRDTGNDETGAP